MKMFEYAKLFIGTVYKIGGDNPMAGFDCSGLICEVLRAYGYLSYNERLNAQQLWERFSKSGQVVITRYADIQADDLIFFGSDTLKGHVSIATNVMNQMVEAGGGDFSTDTLVEATERDAFVRLRPTTMRKDFYRAVRLR